jgi:hypothetical protein
LRLSYLTRLIDVAVANAQHKHKRHPHDDCTTEKLRRLTSLQSRISSILNDPSFRDAK